MVKIDSVKFGEVDIDGKTYYSDMVIWWTGDMDFRPKSRILPTNEMRKILEKNPEVIVVGAGIIGSLIVDENTQKLAEQKNVSLYVEKSEKAIELFNAFIADKKHVVAIIQTTG